MPICCILFCAEFGIDDGLFGAVWGYTVWVGCFFFFLLLEAVDGWRSYGAVIWLVELPAEARYWVNRSRPKFCERKLFFFFTPVIELS